jgi:hypothetical protein
MKKVIFGFLVLTVMFATSCKKNSSSTLAWSIYGITYNQGTCQVEPVYGTNELVAVSANPTSTIYADFYNGTVPTGSGTFYVTNNPNPTASNLVFLEFDNATTGVDYFSTGGNGTTKVAISVSASGKISLNASNVEMLNTTTSIDSTAMNINIAQQ